MGLWGQAMVTHCPKKGCQGILEAHCEWDDAGPDNEAEFGGVVIRCDCCDLYEQYPPEELPAVVLTHYGVLGSLLDAAENLP